MEVIKPGGFQEQLLSSGDLRRNPPTKRWEGLIEAFQTIRDSEHSVYDIFDNDTIRVRACALLFNSIEEIPVIKAVLKQYKWL